MAKTEVDLTKISQLPEAESIEGLVTLGVDDTNKSVKVPIDLLKGNIGDPGPQGYTPEIGENGNWWINGVDTGEIATGDFANYTPNGGYTGNAQQLDDEKANKSYFVNLPTQKSETVTSYAGVNLAECESSGGDLATVGYANKANILTKKGILSKLHVRASNTGLLTIRAVKVTDNAGVFTTETLHNYTPISITIGTNEYTINDAYVIPSGALLMFSCSPAVLNFKTGGVGSYRISLSSGSTTSTSVSVAVNFDVNDIELAKDILTESEADIKYVNSDRDLASNIEGFGYIKEDGSIQSAASVLLYTKKYYSDEKQVLRLKVRGASNFKQVAFYKADGTVISTHGVNTTATSWFEATFKLSEIPDLAYFICSYRDPNTDSGNISTIIINEDIAGKVLSVYPKNAYSYIAPKKIYTVCNNIPAAKKGRSRNYTQSVFLDHFFNGFTSEPRIRFKESLDKISLRSPIVVTDTNTANPAVEYNGGVNILEQIKAFGLTGNDMRDTTFSIIHRSVLNSVTSATKPRILCIGTSITYGEMATVHTDNYTKNHAYHVTCKELFMKDAVDNGNSGFDVMFLGTQPLSKVFDYNGNTYTAKSFHEGIRGIRLEQHLNGAVPKFWDAVNSRWSLQAYLDQYRTMDDNGNRLTLGDDTGSLITSDNLNTIDVCTPTHIIIELGANGGGTLAQYQQLVGRIKDEFPNMIVALVMPDSAGTYFPSLHPNFGEQCTIWNDTGSQGSRHSQQYGLQQMLQAYYDSRENVNEYMLPFFFVAPTAESVSNRLIGYPENEVGITDVFHENYGYAASTHVNGIGHANWAYCLYSWLKYTIAKEL